MWFRPSARFCKMRAVVSHGGGVKFRQDGVLMPCHGQRRTGAAAAGSRWSQLSRYAAAAVLTQPPERSDAHQCCHHLGQGAHRPKTARDRAGPVDFQQVDIAIAKRTWICAEDNRPGWLAVVVCRFGDSSAASSVSTQPHSAHASRD